MEKLLGLFGKMIRVQGFTRADLLVSRQEHYVWLAIVFSVTTILSELFMPTFQSIVHSVVFSIAVSIFSVELMSVVMHWFARESSQAEYVAFNSYVSSFGTAAMTLFLIPPGYFFGEQIFYVLLILFMFICSIYLSVLMMRTFNYSAKKAFGLYFATTLLWFIIFIVAFGALAFLDETYSTSILIPLEETAISE